VITKAEADAAELSTSGNLIFPGRPPNPRHSKSGSIMSRGSTASADPSINMSNAKMFQLQKPHRIIRKALTHQASQFVADKYFGGNVFHMNTVIATLAVKLEKLRSAFWQLHTPHRSIDEVSELQPILLLFIKDVLATIQDGRSVVAAGGMKLILIEKLYSKHGDLRDHAIKGYTDVLLGNNTTSFETVTEFVLVEAKPPRGVLMGRKYDEKDQLAFQLQAAAQGRLKIVKGCLTDLFSLNIMLMIPASTSSMIPASTSSSSSSSAQSSSSSSDEPQLIFWVFEGVITSYDYIVNLLYLLSISDTTTAQELEATSFDKPPLIAHVKKRGAGSNIGGAYKKANNADGGQGEEGGSAAHDANNEDNLDVGAFEGGDEDFYDDDDESSIASDISTYENIIDTRV
jgi:hypothetical protein